MSTSESSGGDPHTTDRTLYHEVRWPTDRGPWLARVGFGLVAGRVECTSVELRLADEREPARLTPSVVKSLPLARFFDEARTEQQAGFQAMIRPELSTRWNERTTTASEAGIDANKRGRPRLNDELVQQVALIYLSEPRRPTTAVATHFNIHITTAVKWIARAREIGLIEPKPSRQTTKPSKQKVTTPRQS